MLSDIDIRDYKLILKKLSEILIKNNSVALSKVLDDFLHNLENHNTEEFIKSVNSAEMWGGAGSIMDLYIPDKNIESEFLSELSGLLTLMERTGILGSRARSRKKLFR